jgi:hypothetical protein
LARSAQIAIAENRRLAVYTPRYECDLAPAKTAKSHRATSGRRSAPTLCPAGRQSRSQNRFRPLFEPYRNRDVASGLLPPRVLCVALPKALLRSNQANACCRFHPNSARTRSSPHPHGHAMRVRRPREGSLCTARVWLPPV